MASVTIVGAGLVRADQRVSDQRMCDQQTVTESKYNLLKGRLVTGLLPGQTRLRGGPVRGERGPEGDERLPRTIG